MKSGSLPKVMSRNLIESNCKLYQNDLKIEYDSDKGSLDLDDNLFLYDDNDFINYNMTSFDAEKENENKKDNEGEHVARNNRINSCSILKLRI